MKALSQFQVVATISTGGAAYEVSVPPIETLTNSTPSAKYFGALAARPCRKTCGASISAAIVIAAGSVISEPSSGTAGQAQPGAGQRRRHRQPGAPRAIDRARTACSTGRDAATTMTTKTNSGSV